MQDVRHEQFFTKKEICHAGTEGWKDFSRLARELNIATATAEVYGIDCLVAGGELDHEMMAGYLKVNKTSFDIMKQEILSSGDKKTLHCAGQLGRGVHLQPVTFCTSMYDPRT